VNFNNRKNNKREIENTHKIIEKLPSTSIFLQMRMKFPALAIACDKTVILDRTARIISIVVIKDVGLLSKTNPIIPIDRLKISRILNEQCEILILKK
jgi:hypothetical protein